MQFYRAEIDLYSFVKRGEGPAELSEHGRSWCEDSPSQAGARGYVLKSLAGRDLLDAIAAVVRGDTFVRTAS
jgi:hypothetical protein